MKSLFAAAAVSLGLAGCASTGVEQYRAEQPALDLKTYLNGTLDAYELSFEDGEKLRGAFLVQRLDYAGDFNGERNYTLQLESSGPVVPA